MEYGILRVNKVKLNGISKAFQQHHQREASFYKSNPDIDISKIGKDAIGLIDGVITASSKFVSVKISSDLQ